MVALCLAGMLWGIFWIICAVCTLVDGKRKARGHIAACIYIETGKKNPDFRFVPRANLKTVKRERFARVKEKTHESSNFRAVCECPACSAWDLHWLAIGDTRICRNCKFRWKQT